MQAQAADGSIHDFPDETDPSVVDNVMKSYASSLGGGQQDSDAAAPQAPDPATQANHMAEAQAASSKLPGGDLVDGAPKDAQGNLQTPDQYLQSLSGPNRWIAKHGQSIGPNFQQNMTDADNNIGAGVQNFKDAGSEAVTPFQQPQMAYDAAKGVLHSVAGAGQAIGSLPFAALKSYIGEPAEENLGIPAGAVDAPIEFAASGGTKAATELYTAGINFLRSPKTVSGIYQMANKLGIDIQGKQLDDIVPAIQSQLEDVGQQIQQKPLVDPRKDPATTPDVPQLNGTAANLDISKNYHNAVKAKQQAYDDVAATHGDDEVNAPLVQTTLPSAISNLEGNIMPQSKEAAALSVMRRINDRSTSTMAGHDLAYMPVGDLIEMRGALNTLYSNGALKQAGGPDLAALHGTVTDALDQYGQMNPAFASALNKADATHVDIQNSFGNPILSKFWTPEDYHAYQGLDRGISLPLDTVQRGEAMGSKVTDATQLRALNQVLSPDHATALRSNVLQGAMSKPLGDMNYGDQATQDLLNEAVQRDPDSMAQLQQMQNFSDQLKERGIKPGMSPDTESRLGQIPKAVKKRR